MADVADKKSAKKNAKYGVVILPCDCAYEYQDRKYGAGKRLHNLCELGAKARCSVCSKEK